MSSSSKNFSQQVSDMQITRRFQLMGTVMTITVVHPRAATLLDEVERRLRIYEHRFSANDPSSELMALARHAGRQWTVVKPELYDLIATGTAYSLLPTNNLNIAIGPLVKTWRIGFKDARVPAAAEIAAALKLTDPHQIQLDQARQAVFLTRAGMTLDLGALAKGYSADLIAAYLRRQQVSGALINLGGNVVTIGQPADHATWQLGLRDPLGAETAILTTVPLTDQSLVTSGIYERQLVVAGHSYHHLFDSKTGYPLTTNVASLSIRSQLSLDGELWTTMLFGKKVPAILTIVKRLPRLACLLVTTSGKVLTAGDFFQTKK